MSVNVLLQSAERAHSSGNLSAAEQAYRAALVKAPDCHQAFHGLGLLALAVGKTDLALQYLERAVRLAADNPVYQRNLCEIARRCGALERAMAAGRCAVRLDSKNPEGHYNFGLALNDAGQHDEAIRSYRRAVRLRGTYGLAWNNLGAALEAAGDKAAAAQAYARAVALDAGHAEAQNNLGALKIEAGELDDARACFNAAISARAGFVDAHYNLSTLKTYQPDDPHIAALEALAANPTALVDADQIRLQFALGKAREDCGQYDAAFAAYSAGNALHFARYPDNEAHTAQVMQDLQQLFDAAFCRASANAAEESPIPIFIVGMPRSGTTLVEQILASHPQVFGAGELKDLQLAASEICGANGQFTVNALKDADFAAIGAAYRARIRQLAPDARYITDKMPANFASIGLINKALPEARIIHAQRDPLDSCFSCYSRHFKDAMYFTYDLGVLARYYRQYIRLMRHWHAVLEPGRVLNVHYENVVSDIEPEVRRLLDYCGLPWDPRCLEFHHNRRVVLTASAAQVRRPLYSSSVARWRHFEPHLAPLISALTDERSNGRARE